MNSLYKKSVALLILLFAVGWQAMATESCGIVFNLYNDYGNGWNGNKLVVNDGNTLNEELTFNNGSSASFTLTIAEGSHVTLSWVEGNYSYQCYFSVQFENGYTIYEGGDLIDTTYEFDLNCDEANTPVTIAVSIYPDEAGTASGGGDFVCGETCTVTATPYDGYSFWCWFDVDEGKVISTETIYTFTVTGPKNLEAEFRSVSNANNIVFADPNVEIICIQQGWDTDNDLYLSYAEAAAVTNLDIAFNNKNITSFNELQYFTGLTSIGDNAFSNCNNLTLITIPNSVTLIEDFAFSYCISLTSVFIPNTVTAIGESPFDGCSALVQITVEEGNPVYDSRDNCNAIIKSSTNTLIQGCQNTIIPNTVTSIDIGAFAEIGSLISMTIPNSVTSIGDYAFCWCPNLTSISIPNSVTTIGEGAFSDCYNLTSITLPNSLTIIGNWAFSSCGSLTSLVIPGFVASIGDNAFGGCPNLTSITVQALTPPALGSDVFQDVNNNIPVYIPGGTFDAYSSADGWNAFANLIERSAIEFADENVETICLYNFDADGNGEISYVEAAAVTDLGSAFSGNQLITSFDELQYFIGLSAIGDNAFSGCSGLTMITMPNSITSIGQNAFSGCSGFTLITMPDSLTSIGQNAFAGCTGLTSIRIPETVTTIGGQGFSGCTGLTTLYVNATTPPALGTSAFQEVNHNIPVYVPGGTTSAYRAADGWNEFVNYIETSIFFADTIVETICLDFWDIDRDGQLTFEEAAMVTDLWGAFQGNEEITSFDELQYFTRLDYIDYSEFEGCVNLSSVVIPNSVTTISNYAFHNCTSLPSIEIPSSVTSIGEGAFYDCDNLLSIIIPSSVTSIGAYAFIGCNSLLSVVIPSSVTFIGVHAFVGSALAEIVVEGENPVYDSRDNCNAIIETASNTLVNGCKNTTIPNSVTSIGEGAFSWCNSLTSIVIPNSVTSIGDFAFGMTWLTSLTIMAATPPTLGESVFDDVDKSIPVYVPQGTIEAYSNAYGWSEFTNYHEILTIDFTDANVETICLTLWDSDHDGLLSFVEAEAVSELGTAFQNHTEINSFNELHYFTGLDSISAHAFEGCTALAAVTLPDTVTIIGEETFSGCTALSEITIPAAVTNIGEEAFSGCTGLASMDVEATVPPILGTSAFQNVDKNIPVHVPDGSTSAYRATPGWEEFFNYVETNILFADTIVETICLSNWDIDGNGKLSYEEAAAVTDLGGVFQGEEITSFDELQYFTGLTSLVYEGYNYGTFYGCTNLTSVVIPNAVAIIGESAFEGCTSLEFINIPNSVTSIEPYAFYYCASLTSITIPSSVTSIGEGLLGACNALELITVEEGNPVYDSRDNCNAIIETATNTLISGCKNTIIPNTVTSIGMVAFAEIESLISITIPNSVTSIGEYAFSGCTGLTSMKVLSSRPPALGFYVFDGVDKSIPVYIPKGTLGAYWDAEGWNEFSNYIEIQAIVFADDKVKTICLNLWDSDQDGLLSYEEAAAVTDLSTAFQNHTEITSFNELQYFTGLTSISAHAFEGCTALAAITLPETVTSIGEEAFSGCTGLAEMHLQAEVPATLGNNAFLNVPNSISVWIPCETLDVYTTAPGWDYFTNYIDFCLSNIVFADANVKALCVANWDNDGNGEISYAEAAAVTDLGGVFQNKTNITSFDELQYFTGLNSIEAAAFVQCPNLASITIPNSVTSIGDYAFAECSNLASITIPNSVTNIGNAPFFACGGLEQITVAEGNPVYDSRDNCNAIIETATNVLIAGCQNTIIPNTVTYIYAEAFSGIESLTSIVIPSSVQSIGDWAFGDCSGLTSMIIFNPNVHLGQGVFDGITIPQTTFVAASASPAEGGGLLGVYGENNDYQAFMGSYDIQNYVVEYVPQGNGHISSTVQTILAAHHNEGWQFTGWYLDGELASYDPILSFRAFGSFAFEAFFEPCSYLPDPELLSGRFSISGCSTVGFTKSNAIIKGDLMNALSGVYAEFSVITGNGMPGCAYEFGENQWDCMTYDSTALANGIYVELMSTTGADLIPQFYFKGNEDCWHILTGSEWDYLLNQRITESGVRFAFAKVNDVNGLVILPDDWIAGTYMFAHFNEISDYQNNVITSGSWLATLEPAGAVFLPVNGIVNALGSMAYLSGNGEMGAYPGLFISPSGSFLGTELPMTGDIVNVFTSLFGTSLRLAQITPQPNTVTINVATEQSERGIVTGGGEVNCGQTCTVTATANPGYVFQFWKENGQIVSTETIYSFKAKGNRDLVAQFANVDEVCNVVFDLMGPTIGWGGNALHVEYEGVSFELTMPTPEALSFFELESMMGSSETITKTYPVFIDRDATVNLSWYSALGEMPGSGASFAIHYEDGDMIFEGDEESLAEPYQFVCSCEDVSCEIIAFSMPSSDYGNVYGGGMYTYGETCTLIAYANDGYHFTGWKENDVLVCESPVYQFTVTSSRLLWAEFAVNNYYTFSLATEPEEGGVLYAIEDDMPYPIETPYSSYEPVEEMDLSIWAKAKEGWRFAYWTANDEIVSYDNFYHFHLSRDADLVAHFVECEFEPQPDENLLSGRFSVSGCTTVGFAKGNMIAQFQIDTIFTYNLIGTSWQFAETQYYRQEYDSLAIVENGISPQLLSSGMDLISGLNQAMGLVDIGCWHELSGSEWDYLLNQRDAEVRYAFAEVDGVSGLLVLPDNWQSAIYALNAPNAAADYATNPITLSEWENILEPAGALFLPANGTIEKMGMSSSSNYIYALNGTDGEQYRPVGIYGELMFAPFAQEPIGGGVMTGIIGMDMMMAQIDMYSCKRLAQIVQMETSTVNVIASQTEHGLVSGEGQFACNAECTLTATPNEGYVFQYWMEGSSVVSVENPYVFTVEGDRSLTAVFVDADEVCNVQFDLDCGSNSYGMFGMGGEALQLSFDDGTPDIHLTMPVPKIDWYAILFAQMIGETFDPTTYGFPTSCSYSIPINKGTDVDMSLVPLQLSVLSQMGSSNPVSNTFSASYVFGDPIVENSGSGDTPSFQCNCEGFIVNLNLSVDPEEGGEIQTEGFPNYGEAVTVTAVANEGYHFVNWTFNGTVVSTEPTYSLVAMEDGDLVAHFDINYYEVTAVANPEEGGTVTSGTDIVFVLYDSYGDGWNGNQLLVYFNGSQIPNNYLTLYSGSSTVIHVPISSGSTVTLAWQTGSYPEECSFKVCYADGTLIYSCTSPRTSLPYSFVCNGNNGTYPYGSICTLMAEANEGYTFVNWMENGEVVSTDYWYEFEVTSDRELVANFSPPITITATANPSEGGTVTGAGTFDYGTYCTLTATPNEGFVFSAWTEDGEVAATDAIYGFTVTQERHLVAEFLPLYTITVSANPNEGGMVNGDGIYAEGSTCTLTATTNTGYTFISWTREGAVISAEPTYTFTVTGAGDYVANFSLKTYEITAMVTPTEAGTVNGTGTYTHGTQCTLTAMPGEDYTFMYWFEGGNMVSYDATYSFIATGDRSFVAHFAENEQTFILESGWTWLSSYIEMEDINGLAMLENGLNPNGVMIKSQRDGFLSYANGMWIGTLDAITNEKMYLVNTSASTEVIITGPVAQLNAHPITLNPNWTWLGYPSPFAMDIDDALSNLNPTNGDVVKSQSSFAAYNDVDGWYGTLSTLTPGMGLMYQSHNSQPVTFNYGVGMNRALRANLTAEDNHWVPDVHAYPNNMNIMAVVELNGVELENERYELAIFDGNECRGSVRLIYVESMRRYVAFLTVAGEEDAELCLALYDTMTGEAYYNTTDCLNFEANAVLGSLSMPYIARFGGTAELNELGDPTVVLYPNPVSAGHLFQMALPDESKGARVSIVNALGAVVSTTDVYDKPAILCAPAVPGVYTVRIVTAKQGTYCRKLIVK